MDGVVAEGESTVDQSTITGESLPVETRPGSQVFAGSVNQSGALEIEVGRVGRDTTFGRVVDAVERAAKHRAPIQKIADRLAGYLVFCAGAAAVVTFAVTRNVQSTIAVIIVAGACGVAAGATTCDPWRDWPGGALWGDHQRGHSPRGAVVHRHRRPGQDRKCHIS